MYQNPVTSTPLSTTLVEIKYDCCGKIHTLKWRDAENNFQKNQGCHVCRICNLKVNNPAKRDEVKAKIRQTNLERYGNTVACNTEETKRRIAAQQDKEFFRKRAEKSKKTNLERYGVEYPSQNPDVMAKAIQTNLERYGVENPTQTVEVQQKKIQTCLDRYGVDNPAKLIEFQIKRAKTNLERYGVEYYNQLPEMKDYLRENCTIWLAESYAVGGPMKGKKRPENWNQKQSETIAKLIDEGKWKASYKSAIRGTYQSTKSKRAQEYFRSSYELRCHHYLNVREDVEWYEYEPFYIPYRDTEGKQRWYFPDFVIQFRDNPLLLVEVKNDYYLEAKITKSKIEAAKHLATSMGMTFEVWSDEVINQMARVNEIPVEFYTLSE